MSLRFKNPTPMVLGSTGTLAGMDYRVVGRLVMGTDEQGETYYWNEFHLLGPEDRSALLVHEPTESGEQWRLFTPVDVPAGLTAAEASTKRPGDSLSFDGKVFSIDHVGESKVHFLEGTPPEGCEIGDRARYVNARAGRSMIVLSWTGDELECFRGMDVYRGVVSVAFKWPVAAVQDDAPAEGAEHRWLPWAIGSFLLFAALIIGISLSPGSRSRPASKRIQRVVAPQGLLELGVEGVLDDAPFRVVRREWVEVAYDRKLITRHEYHIHREGGTPAILVAGWGADGSDWAVAETLDVPQPPTPLQAAALKRTDQLTLNGEQASVTLLFLSTLKKGEGLDVSPSPSATVRYGVMARQGNTDYMVRWSEAGLRIQRLRLLPGPPQIGSSPGRAEAARPQGPAPALR